MFKAQRVLVVAPHMDDEVYGVGGTIARFVSEGSEVYVVVLTESCGAQYPDRTEEMIQVKKAESQKVSKILGIKEYFFYDFPDGELCSGYHLKCNRAIERAISDVQPQVIFTSSWSDVHKDHRAVFESTLVAARPLSGRLPITIYAYEVPSSTEWGFLPRESFTPTTYVNISDFISKKVKAAKAYQSEMRDYPHPRSEEGILYYARFRGLSVGVEFAEAFALVREIL